MALSMGQTAGSPYVTLTKTGTNGDFTVTRTVAGVATPVRGTLTVAAGTGALVDREAPQGVSVSYSAGADSTSGTTNKVGAYLIHPTNSALDVKVQVSSYPAWTRAVPEDVFTPLNGPSIVVSGRRGGRAGSVLLNVDSAALAGVEAFLNASRVALLSTYDYPAPYVWVALGAESWEPKTHVADDPYWQVEIPLTEIARPTVTTSGRVTWLDVAARLTSMGQPATWQAAAAQWGTWQALLDDAATWNS